MAMSVEHRSKFEALRRQWWRLQMSEEFSSRTINLIQTNKQTNFKKSQIEEFMYLTIIKTEFGYVI